MLVQVYLIKNKEQYLRCKDIIDKLTYTFAQGPIS